MKICENCGNTHKGEYGSGRFCSPKCSRGFSTKNKRADINLMVSEKLKGIGNGDVNKKCLFCDKEFIISWSKRDQACCSLSCASRLKWLDNDYKERMRVVSTGIAKRNHENPDIKFGWRTRSRFSMSYPEKLAKSVLDENSINYVYEYPLFPYFIDFAIPDHKIAIEIDGRQHNLPERIKSDFKKDNRLKESGWTVYRIKWPNDNIIDSVKNILASIPSP